MNSTNRRLDYEERMSLVTAYIYDHLDDQLDLNTLADIACMSPYHWHRVYHALRGETAAATVKRLRLQRAAVSLARTSMSVQEIAEQSGYKNVQSFTRIFSSIYGMPPGQYRTTGSHAEFELGKPAVSSASYELEVQTAPELTVLSVAHQGSYMEIGRGFDQLFGWLGARDLITPDMRLIGIFYDDPSMTGEEELRSRACVTTQNAQPIEEPLESTQISGGKYAILSHKGPYATMKAAYEWLFGTWLINSSYEPADQPVYEEYLNSPQDTPPAELRTNICLPLN